MGFVVVGFAVVGSVAAGLAVKHGSRNVGLGEFIITVAGV
jgi:hypothetical protein